MPVPTIAVEIIDTTPPEGMQRAHTRTMKRVYSELGTRWVKEFLPLHLAPGAKSRYGYQERKPATQKRKQRLAERGFVPLPVRELVDRGKLLDTITNRMILVRGFPSRATIYLPTPLSKQGREYVTIVPKDPQKPHLFRELTRLIPPEQRSLAERAREDYYRWIIPETKKRGRPRKKKIT